MTGQFFYFKKEKISLFSEIIRSSTKGLAYFHADKNPAVMLPQSERGF